MAVKAREVKTVAVVDRSITPLGGALLTIPIYGISSVVCPTSYTYIVQTITIINTSTTTSPVFISFLSLSGYKFFIYFIFLMYMGITKFSSIK
jgi:hypothetical protein